MAHLGDFDTSAVIYGKFTTYRPSTGAAYALAGTPALSVYKDNSTTQSTSGITLTTDFDGVTGLNHFTIDTSADGSFYAAGSFFDIVITTGTVDSVSVVGSVVGSFTLRKDSSLKPATAGRTLAVGASGQADANVTQFGGSNLTATGGRPEVNASHWGGTAVGSTEVRANLINIAGAAVSTTTAQLGVNVVQVSGDATAADNLEAAFDDAAGAVPQTGIIDQGTAQSASSTGVVLRSAAAFADNVLIGATIAVYGSDQGYWQTRVITDNALSGDTVTVDAWTVTPTGTTITYKIFATPPASGLTDIADAILARDIGSGTNALTATNERTVRSALRFLRNKWAIATGTLTVTTENDTTTAWTSELTTDGAAEPVTSSDPASS